MNLKDFQLDEIGQFIMTGVGGKSLSREEKKFLDQKKIGGVILFAHNYESPDQLAKLTQEIQSLGHEWPFFIGVDQEGGRVQRFKDPFKRIPPMFDLGQLDSTEICRRLHQIIGRELKSVGVNLSFSPVCDVLTNPKNQVIGDRAFSSDPDKVGEYVMAAIQGLRESSLLSVAKHFPGHGDTVGDSHYELPLIEKSIPQMSACELMPFHRAVSADVDMILMAHLQVNAFDSERPTTLSSSAYDFLRNELKYSGVIISDDMEMKAIADHFGWEDATITTFLAGCDILVYRSMLHAEKAYETLVQSIQNDQCSEEALGQKISRIKALKDKRLRDDLPRGDSNIFQVINSPKSEHFLLDLRAQVTELKSRKQD